MAATNKKDKKKLSRTAELFRKLDLSKDERLTRIPVEGGRIGHFFRTFKRNYTELMLANLLFMVFAIPAVLIIFWLTPKLISTQNALLDFNGDMGIGLGGRYETALGMMNIYNSYEVMFLALIPCFTVMGLGMAGLFYVCRNLLWGASVKIRVHFFRGIKKRWAEFLLAFTFLGGVIAMMGCSVLEYFKADLYGYSNAGHIVAMVLSAIFLLATIIYLIVALPMHMSFRFKFGSVIKNSCILGGTMILTILIVLVFLAIPMLCLMNSFLKVILYVAIAMIGFSFYVLAVSALSQNMFDNTIIPLYEYQQRQAEKEERQEAERNRNNNGGGGKSKSKKKKKKKR